MIDENNVVSCAQMSVGYTVGTPDSIIRQVVSCAQMSVGYTLELFGDGCTTVVSCAQMSVGYTTPDEGKVILRL